MINNIRYHDYNDSLWFESDNLGDCDIDKDGDKDINENCIWFHLP